MQHLEVGTIHAWLDGELSATERAQAEQHVAECAECAAAVAEARGLIAGAARIVSALDVVRGGVLPQQPSRPAAAGSIWRTLRLTPTRAALAASLLIAAGALLSVRQNHSNDLASSRLISDTNTTIQAVSPSAPEAAPPAAQRLAQPASVGGVRKSPGPAASPKVAAPTTAMRDSARAKTELAAAGGSAGAVAVDSRVEPQRTAIDSVAAKARASAANAGASADARRQFQRSVQLNEVVTTGSIEPAPGGSDIVGCYQIKAEPNTVALLLPGRFALERSSGAAAPNVVRAVTPEWRKDSVVRGSNWIQLADNKAEIQSIDGRKRQVVSLSLTSLVAGQATMPGISQPVAVLRAPCRP